MELRVSVIQSEDREQRWGGASFSRAILNHGSLYSDWTTETRNAI
jgi:hypothetical protein